MWAEVHSAPLIGRDQVKWGPQAAVLAGRIADIGSAIKVLLVYGDEISVDGDSSILLPPRKDVIPMVTAVGSRSDRP